MLSHNPPSLITDRQALNRVLPTIPANASALAGVVSALPKLGEQYRPWRKFRHVAKDLGVHPELAWAFVKNFQSVHMRKLDDLRQANGSPFFFVQLPALLDVLHRLDRNLGSGGPALLDRAKGPLGSEEHLVRLRIKTLMDEAAESALIEGASGTRKDALELLRSGRAPAKHGEKMIVNNYLAMQRVKGWLSRSISIDMLLELQSILTEGTLDDVSEQGRLRLPEETVRVVDLRDDTTIYTPPSATGLRERLERICDFANKEHSGQNFIHPIIKASMLHFMIGYEHPFCDGNGRTARAVFYWLALRQGYSIFEYLPISERIRAGHSRYPQAYLDSEEEGGDLTHFILYKLDIIEQSLDRFAIHLRREEEKVLRAESLLRKSRSLNLRQRILLEHVLRHPGAKYTARSHLNSSGVKSLATARKDLEGLAKVKCLTKSVDGQEVVYHPAPGLIKRLQFDS